MRKQLFILLLVAAICEIQAAPATGGLKGRRVIVQGEFAYAPFLTSFKDFYTKYDLQYGGNLNLIVGRYSQLAVFYNRWSLGNNQVIEGNLHASDRVDGTQYGVRLRQFRKKKGGLAPIGKFYDYSVSYAQNKFMPGASNPDVLYEATDRLPKFSDQVIINFGIGTQQVFWKHLVLTSGVRFGAPVFEVNRENGIAYGNFLLKRIAYKEIFGVFFGVGFLI
ncbi:MAG TPA: hypothetical protein VI731_01720 [Bacteroidia bacterium]|nr:hypothetical protein [Bacteroidia bacterium]